MNRLPFGQQQTTTAQPVDMSAFIQVNPTPAQPVVVHQPQTRALTVISDKDIQNFGTASTNRISATSQKILAGTKASAVDDFGDKLNELVATTKKLDPADIGKPSLIKKLFGIGSSVKDQFQAQYQTVEQRMNTLIAEIDSMAKLMEQRIDDLETMYKENEDAYKQLSQDIAQINSIVATMKADLAAQPTPTDPIEAQRLNDYQELIDRLEKRADDLERGKQLVILSLPEIRIEQTNKRNLVASIATLKSTTIPAYQGLFSRYILAMETKKGNQVVAALQDATDEAFRKQADLVRQNAVDSAKAQQRSVVTTETLIHCRDQMLATLDDVKKINDAGRKARQDARPQLEQLEQSLIARAAPQQLSHN